jgi:TetR/AcrR family transcriptional regulator, transcriptional repressor of aconitase
LSPKVSKEHKEQRRASILAAAKTVFIRLGYEKTTIKDVMEEASVSRGGLYQYFSNKEDLYEAILSENLQQAITAINETLSKEHSSYWNMLVSLILGEDMEANDEMDPLAPVNLEFFITGKNDPRRREYAIDRYSEGIKLYEKIILKGEKAGEFQLKMPADIISQSINTFIDGLALGHVLLPEQQIRLKEQTQLLMEYLRWVLGVES